VAGGRRLPRPARAGRSPGGTARRRLAHARELLDRYAEAAGRIGEQDVADVPTGSLSDAVRFVVVTTVLLEPVLLALRRLAQENASRRRFPDVC
jgi:hypothetical protein